MSDLKQDWLEVLKWQRVETKFVNFWDVIHVKLFHLSFFNFSDSIDSMNIKCLKRVFKTENYLKLKSEHHISVIVHKEAL